MNHRIRKLIHKARHEGLVAAVAFVIRDLYFRLLATMVFPFSRQKIVSGNGRDPFGEFVEQMRGLPSARVLEVGSRAVSDVTMRHKFPSTVLHTGLDVHPGPNVDRVGDAHELGALFEPEQFDGVFSLSVFEHLLMPWVVVLEINKVLKPGGLVMVATHPTWPPHELPWDFWRFQENSFWALFNKATGFEIICTVTSTPARIFPFERSSYLQGTTKTIASMGVAVLARKISKSDPRLSWPLKAADVTETYYPTAGAKGPDG
jgi:hypothetical protein